MLKAQGALDAVGHIDVCDHSLGFDIQSDRYLGELYPVSQSDEGLPTSIGPAGVFELHHLLDDGRDLSREGPQGGVLDVEAFIYQPVGELHAGEADHLRQLVDGALAQLGFQRPEVLLLGEVWAEFQVDTLVRLPCCRPGSEGGEILLVPFDHWTPMMSRGLDPIGAMTGCSFSVQQDNFWAVGSQLHHKISIGLVPGMELTPTRIFSCPAMAAALQKIDIDPEQQLYTPKIEDIVTGVIEIYGDI
ncbi:hypothetical protein LAZ67_17002776 [Cordylochernes scorpioides]|uniref:Uncharacterized protein n=1 Tax=Cordylochernes scorpioides TaxID=51811 RepID=A0ABY6LFL1_9ARAC|nr:hypothetical protein LAZ67_17002776 [Cordylochernes scorpioides]